MGQRGVTTYPANEAGLVDKFIGTAYDTVKKVYDNLDEIKHLESVLVDIEDTAERVSQETIDAMLPEFQAEIDSRLGTAVAQVDVHAQQQMDLFDTKVLQAESLLETQGAQIISETAAIRDQASGSAVAAANSANQANDALEGIQQNVDMIVAQAISTTTNNVISYADRAEMAAAAAAQAGNLYPTTAAGLADTVEGDYFSVPSSAAGTSVILYRNLSGSAVEQTRYLGAEADALTLNKGKAYPFRSMTRAGVTSAPNTVFNNLILGAQVTGATPGKYYKIAYYRNGTVIAGASGDGWIVEEFDMATFEVIGTTTQILNYLAPAPVIDPTQGIQTIRLEFSSRTGLVINLIVDATALPPRGTAVNSYTSNVTPGWSWIIDPTCVAEAVPIDGLLVNRGKTYPCAALTRSGVTSTPDASNLLTQALLAARVEGASEGVYYHLAFFKNGSAVAGNYRDGWRITEVTKAGYQEGTATETLVLNYNEPAPDIDRTGITTVHLKSVSRPGLSFYLTLDGSKLPAIGNSVNMMDSARGGWSWVIDPSCYTVGGSVALSGSGSAYTIQNGVLCVDHVSGNECRRTRFGVNGANSLPNIIGVDRANGTDLSSATWVQVNTGSTDYLPPIAFRVMDSGDGGALNYTGGNHTIGGAQTARNILYRVVADGQEVAEGQSGQAARIVVTIVNEVMAYNTVSLNRYALREHFTVTLVGGSIEVTCKRRALENIEVVTDNGPQLVTIGFQGTQLIYGGQTENRVAFDQSGSGPKSSYPDAWALVLQDPVNGQCACWMDRDYGIGDGRHVAGTSALIRFNIGESTKAYHAAVNNSVAALSAGQSYEWRGGYVYQAAGLNGPDLDSTFNFEIGGRSLTAYGVSASDWSVV